MKDALTWLALNINNLYANHSETIPNKDQQGLYGNYSQALFSHLDSQLHALFSSLKVS